jgi:hypothetical protein
MLYKKFQYESEFFENFISLIQFLNQSAREEEIVNSLGEILELEGLKIFSDTLQNIFTQHKKNFFSVFLRNFIIFEKSLTILKRKKFIYLHKLLVLRTLFMEANTKSFKLMKKFYFERWLKMNTGNRIKFEKKVKILKMRNLMLFHENKLSRGGMNFSLKVKTLFNSNTIYYLIFNFLKEKWQSHWRQMELFQNQKIYDNLDNTCVILANYKINNFKSFINKIKSNFGDFFKFKKFLNYFKGSFKLNKISLINKKLVKYFYFWNTYTKKEMIRKKMQLLNLKNKKLILKEIDKNFEFRNLLGILKINFSRSVSYSLSKFFSKAIAKSDNKLLTDNFLSLENTYNHYLLNKIKSIFTLSSLVEKRKKFITNIYFKSNDKDEQKTFLKNGIQNYFNLWKLKCNKISTEKIKTETTFKGINIIFNYIQNKFLRNLKYSVINTLKYNKRNNLINKNSLISKTDFILTFIYNLINKKVIFSDKISFFNLLKIHKFSSQVNDTKEEVILKNNEELKQERDTSKINTYLEKIISRIIFIYKFKNFVFFKSKALAHKNKEETFVLLKKLSSLINLLNNKILNQTKLFFIKLHQLKKNQLLNDFNRKKPADNQIANNLSVINAHICREMGKKQKMVNLTKILKIIYLKRLKKNEKLDYYIIKDLYFSIWKNWVNNEKKLILYDIKNHQEFNAEIKIKIIEYTESTALLESKINEITTRGEKCLNCAHILNDNEMGNTGTINKSMTFNSLNGELNKENFKLNPFGQIKSKTQIDQENTLNTKTAEDFPILNSNAQNLLMNNRNSNPFSSNKEIIEKIEDKQSLNLNREELRGSLLRDSAMFAINTGLNFQNFKQSSFSATNSNNPEDMLILDENLGGLEYFNYLEKTVI